MAVAVMRLLRCTRASLPGNLLHSQPATAERYPVANKACPRPPPSTKPMLADRRSALKDWASWRTDTQACFACNPVLLIGNWWCSALGLLTAPSTEAAMHNSQGWCYCPAPPYPRVVVLRRSKSFIRRIYMPRCCSTLVARSSLVSAPCGSELQIREVVQNWVAATASTTTL